MASPMPEVAPVINAVFPANRIAPPSLRSRVETIAEPRPWETHFFSFFGEVVIPIERRRVDRTT
jgi:hypothetical protein